MALRTVTPLTSHPLHSPTPFATPRTRSPTPGRRDTSRPNPTWLKEMEAAAGKTRARQPLSQA
eukprot:1081670-Rhodomonas_salina.1